MSFDVRVFIVIFDNAKRRRPATPYQRYDAVGVQFARTGHVVIDTYYAPRSSFRNIEEMTEELSKWGKCEITWMSEEVTA